MVRLRKRTICRALPKLKTKRSRRRQNTALYSTESVFTTIVPDNKILIASLSHKTQSQSSPQPGLQTEHQTQSETTTKQSEQMEIWPTEAPETVASDGTTDRCSPPELTPPYEKVSAMGLLPTRDEPSPIPAIQWPTGTTSLAQMETSTPSPTSAHTSSDYGNSALPTPLMVTKNNLETALRGLEMTHHTSPSSPLLTLSHTAEQEARDLLSSTRKKVMCVDRPEMTPPTLVLSHGMNASPVVCTPEVTTATPLAEMHTFCPADVPLQLQGMLSPVLNHRISMGSMVTPIPIYSESPPGYFVPSPKKTSPPLVTTVPKGSSQHSPITPSTRVHLDTTRRRLSFDDSRLS